MKVRCSTCKTEKELSQFYVDRGRRQGQCKSCRRSKIQEWQQAHPKKVQEYRRKARIKREQVDKAQARFRWLRRYGLTQEQYDTLLARQDGVCAVCRQPSVSALHVDHDHRCCPGSKSCGKCVRGLLHLNCNVGLGSFGDDPSLLRNAVAYLEAWDAR